MKNGSGLAILYDRASTAHQRDNWSRDDAARFLDQVVAEHGYKGEVRQEIKSGENLTDRPVMKQLLLDIGEGKVAALVTQDFTRLSRDEDGIDGRVIRQVCRAINSRRLGAPGVRSEMSYRAHNALATSLPLS